MHVIFPYDLAKIFPYSRTHPRYPRELQPTTFIPKFMAQILLDVNGSAPCEEKKEIKSQLCSSHSLQISLSFTRRHDK